MTTITHPASPPATVLQDRVGPLDAVRHILTLAWRSLVQIRHNPMELGDLSLQPLMFVALFAFVFGGAIAGSPKAFLQFGLAGIICQNALFLTMNTGVAVNTDITKGVFDRFRSLPIARSAPLAGRIVADVVRQLWSMAILLGVGTLLGFRFHTNPVSVLGAVVLLVVVACAFSWLPVLVAMLVDEPEKVMMLGFVVVFPLTFASSAFVPVSTMPGWMQAWVAVNPATLLVDAVRGLLVGGEVAAPALGALAWAAAIGGGVRSAGPAGVPAAELTSAASAASTSSRGRAAPRPKARAKPRSPSAARAASRTRRRSMSASSGMPRSTSAVPSSSAARSGVAAGQVDGGAQPEHPGDHRPVVGGQRDLEGLGPAALAPPPGSPVATSIWPSAARATAWTCSTGKPPRR